MYFMKSIEINNSQDSAIKSGKWKNPGASLYDNIMDSDNWSDCLEETYLIAPVKDINNSSDNRTPYSRSGCKYPHHEIKNNRLVLNVAGVKAAYARAKQQGVYHGELKEHLDRHIKELGMLNKDGKYFEDTIHSNFFDIETYLQEKNGYSCINSSIQYETDNMNSIGYKIKKDKNRYLLISSDNEVISQAEFYIYNDIPNFDWINIAGVETKEKYRGSGYAKILLDIIHADLKLKYPNMGFYLLTKVHNQPAISLYKKCGYNILKKQKGDSGDFYVMYRGDADISQLISKNFNTGETQKESSNKSIDDESIKTPEELLSWMNFIGYGWTSIKDNRVYGIGEDDDGEDFYKYYRLQSPQETIDRKYGVCWDQVEVERVWFDHKKIPYDIYYIDHETTTHTFLVFKRNGKYYWFEHSWYTYRGIHEYDSLDVLLEDVRQKHYSTIDDENKPHTLIYTRIGLPKYGVTCQKYVNWARSQPSVIKDTSVQIQESLDWIDRFVNDESFRESCDDRSDSMNWNFFFEDTDDDTDELSDENEENENTEDNNKDHTKKDEKDLMDEPIDEPPSLDDSEDNNEESKDSQEKSSEEDDKTEEKEDQSDSKPLSMPKKIDVAESDKNGVRRKNLYVAFIEWCKKYNSKNAFGSVFDKDAFHVSYPFVPHEMRYFYRLANPMLCVLSGNLTFFALSELKKINSSNKKLDEVIIFAATEKDYRVFCINDKKVYLAHEGENGEVLLDRALANSFDLYIQNMIGQGDILNAPIEKKEPAKTETPIEDDTSTSEEN